MVHRKAQRGLAKRCISDKIGWKNIWTERQHAKLFYLRKTGRSAKSMVSLTGGRTADWRGSVRSEFSVFDFYICRLL